MAGERYVALGLAHVRSPWFTDVARWSTAGSVPLEFVKCVSIEELRARLSTGRRFSAILVDGSLAAVDRDLVDLATASGAVTLVVDDGRGGRDWSPLGAAEVLPADFSRSALLDALSHHTSPISAAGAVPGSELGDAVVTGWRGRLVAVAGAGGVGSSSVAMALTQGLGDDARYAGMLALVDCSLDADLALLHDARDIVPGIQELVEAHRSGRPTAEQVKALTFRIENRHYQLVLGLRRHRDWVSLRVRAFEAAVDGLQRTFRVVVADTDPDLEGEEHCGSYDVEERNVMARTLAHRADVVVAVGLPGVKGLHALVRTVYGLREHGVEPGRILVVVNRASRNARAKAELSRAFSDLSGTARDGAAVMGPIFLPERGGIDDLHRDGARLPKSLSAPLAGAVRAAFDRSERPSHGASSRPVVVTPGSLGTWDDQEAAGQ